MQNDKSIKSGNSVWLKRSASLLDITNKDEVTGKDNENKSINSAHEINGRISKPVWLSLFIIILSVNHLFNLVPWAKVQGTFNSSDIGLLVLVLLLLFLLGSGRNRACLNNGVSYVILAYLFMVTAQVANVSFNFGQSLLDGLVASRHQLYYLSFFVFMMLFDCERSIKQFLNFMMIIGVALSVAGLINYFGITIFYHKWAEGHGERAGIVRAYFSGMGVITFSLFWVISQWLVAKKIRIPREFYGVLLIAALIMRQTRSTVIGVFATVVILLIHKRKKKALYLGGVFVIILASIISVYNDSNILIDPFVSAYTDITEGGGTWEPRLKQLETSIATFIEHPVFGGGTYAIRLNLEGKSLSQIRELVEAHENADLGYMHWLKAYGIVGGLWLLALYGVVYKYIKYITHKANKQMEPFVLMAAGYTMFVVITFITDPHFIWADRILLICIALALMVRVKQLTSNSL